MEPKLRVAVVSACPFPYPRGTPVRALRLTEALARLGHELHVATYHVGEGAVAPAVRVHRIRAPMRIAPLHPGPTPGKLFVLDPLLVRTVRRMLARYGPFDVIHAHHYEGLLVALAAVRIDGRRTPVVYDAHTLLATELPSYSLPLPRGVRTAVGRMLDRALPGRAEHVIAVSATILDRLVASGAASPEHGTVVANGVEETAFVVPTPRATPPPNGGTVVYAGNLAPYHRIDLLLEAFSHVLVARPRTVLRLLTDSPTASLVEQAEALGVADRVEARSVPFDRLPDELAAAHVAVNPRPICDGIPQKNLNYMAAGLPIVAFAGSLHPCRHGETGIAVPTGRPRDLADAILDVLAAPERANRLGESARALARAAFSWDDRARRVEGVYRGLTTARADSGGRSRRFAGAAGTVSPASRAQRPVPDGTARPPADA